MELIDPLINDIVNHDHDYTFIGRKHNIINHDHDYAHIEAEVNDIEKEPVEPKLPKQEPVLNLAIPETYTTVFGAKQNTEIIRDNLGFMYNKNKITNTKIYLGCREKKLEAQCRATACISLDRNDNSFVLSHQHNHSVRPFNLDIPLLRQIITEKALQTSKCSYNPRGIYMESIVNFPNGALDYTFLQSSERMRRLRKKLSPPTPQKKQDLHVLLIAED